MTGVQFQAGAGNSSLCYCIQTSCGAHPPSSPVGTRGSFPRDKVVGAWNWLLTSM